MRITTVNTDLTISPDGAHIVNVGGGQDNGLVIRALDRLESERQPLGMARSPFMSPDGMSIGFVASGTGVNSLKRVSVFGGPSVTICDLPLDGGFQGVGASWGADDTIIFGSTLVGGLWRVSASGGEPEPLTTPNAELGEVSHNWPEILPGGRAVLFTIISAGSIENAQIAVLNLDTRVQTPLVSAGSQPKYSPTGHIVYGVGGTLRAVGFDLDRLEVTTNALPVLDGVITKASGAANFSFSRDGTLIYVPEIGGMPERTLVWVDREGREEPLGLEPGAYAHPRVSPDGTHIAVDISGPGGSDVWTRHVARETMSILTPEPADETNPLWTPGGERVAFRSEREPQGLFWKAADGRGAVEPLLTRPEAPQLQFLSDLPPHGCATSYERAGLISTLPSAAGMITSGAGGR